MLRMTTQRAASLISTRRSQQARPGERSRERPAKVIQAATTAREADVLRFLVCRWARGSCQAPDGT
jgi:hypothetical protein